jgi:hypothetical protein
MLGCCRGKLTRAIREGRSLWLPRRQARHLQWRWLLRRPHVRTDEKRAATMASQKVGEATPVALDAMHPLRRSMREGRSLWPQKVGETSLAAADTEAPPGRDSKKMINGERYCSPHHSAW